MRTLIALALTTIATAAHAQQGAVIVNGKTISPALQQRIHAATGIAPVPGRWWYDARSGAFGPEGAGAMGVLPAGLPLGRLKTNASRGTSGVFVNGRQLTRQEVTTLSRLGPVRRGRYWLDANGTFGLEGGPALGNLAAAARRTGRPTMHRGQYTDIGTGTDGQGGVYVIGEGFSYSNF